jgi:hypothetical protein
MIFFKRYFLLIAMVPSKVLICYEGTEGSNTGEQPVATAACISLSPRLQQLLGTLGEYVCVGILCWKIAMTDYL